MSGSGLRRDVQLIVWGLMPVLALTTAVLGTRITAYAEAAVATPSTAARYGLARGGGAHVVDITRKLDPERTSFGRYSETWGDNLVVDLNRDGNADVVLSNHLQPWEVWLGDGNGGFTFAQPLSALDRHNCAAADFGGPNGRPDGRMDLYCARGAAKGTLNDKHNEILIQQADGRLVAEPGAWGADDPSGRSRTVSILRIRHDRLPSLFVGDRRGNRYPSFDHIYVNTGHQRFRIARTAGLPSEQDTDCSSTGDFDHDGRQDFLACSHALHLYRNATAPHRPVSYRQVAAREGILPGHRLHAELVDLDRDGWKDLVTITKEALTVSLNRRHSPHFAKVDYRFPLSAGFSFCSGAANADGVPDLLVVQGLTSNSGRLQRGDWMLLNSGSGKAFRPLGVPQPPRRNGSSGNGDTCTAIPNYRGKVSAWTINNGRPTYQPERRHRGYRQLVTLTR